MTVRVLNLRNKLKNIITSKRDFSTKITFPERFKGTIVEKWANYWKVLLADYKEVFLDVGKEIRTKPVKASIYGVILGSAYLCGRNNPDELEFINQLRNYNNEIILVNDSSHNPESAQHLRFLERCYNQGIIRRLTFGVVSFIWLDNYDEGVALYKAMCPHLKPRYLTFYERIIDIGFWNKWWNLEKKMIDYDVNV